MSKLRTNTIENLDNTSSVDISDVEIKQESYINLGEYATVSTPVNYDNVVTVGGVVYRLKTSTVAPYSLNGDWAVDEPKFVALGDSALRSMLESSGGAAAVGYGDGTVAGALSELASALPAGSQVDLPAQRYSTADALSRISTVPAALSMAPASIAQELTFVFVANSSNAITVYWDADFSTTPGSIAGSGLSVVAYACSDLNRSSAVAKASSTVLEAGQWKTTIAADQITDSYVAVSLQLASGSSMRATVRKVKAIQSGTTRAVDSFNLIKSSQKWSSNTRRADFVYGAYNYSVQMTLALTAAAGGIPSGFSSPERVDVAPYGSDRYAEPPYSLSFYFDTIQNNASDLADNVSLASGDYNFWRKNFIGDIKKDVALVSSGGPANLYAGKELKRPNWTQVATSPIYYYTAPYDWDTNPTSGVRAGTSQPFLTALLDRDNPDSVYSHNPTNVTSAALVASTPYSYWYDHANKTMHFSFSATNEPTRLFVAEMNNGLTMTTGQFSLISAGVHIYAPKVTAWDINPPSYSPVETSGKFVSLHSCGGYSGLTGNGFGIDNIDSEVVDCIAGSNGYDGFNYHDYGKSLIVGGLSTNNGDDGVSHHEATVGLVDRLVMKYNGAGASTPAFGAYVYHRDCRSVAPSTGSKTPKLYAGSYAVLSGQGGDTTGVFDNCMSDLNGSAAQHYMNNPQQAGTTATLVVIRPRVSSTSDILISEAGPGTSIVTSR